METHELVGSSENPLGRATVVQNLQMVLTTEQIATFKQQG